jgi:hypothetical protein
LFGDDGRERDRLAERIEDTSGDGATARQPDFEVVRQPDFHGSITAL